MYLVHPIVFSLLLLLASFSQADDLRDGSDQLVIMTLNAEFLWDRESPEEGQVHFPWKGNRQEARDHMREIAELIQAADPDLVNLVEVEGRSAVETLNRDFLSGEAYRVYVEKGTDTFTGQDVALLTRVDPEANGFGRYSAKGESGPVEKTVSKNYFAKLDIDGRKIAVIGLHFLARPSSPQRLHPRQAQADAIRDLAISLKRKATSS